MLTLPKTKKVKSGKKTKGSALDSAQRELLARQSEIQAQIDAIQASIAQVPQRGVKPAPRSGSATGARYVHGATVRDARRVKVIAPEPPRRRTAPKPPVRLRAEVSAARQQTFALLIGLAIAVMYALSHFLT